MKKYELLLALPGTLDENEAKKHSEEVLTMVKECDTEAVLTAMGKTRLAYPIKQIRYGYFYTIVFSAETTPLKVIQEKLGLSRDLLRAVISEYNAKFNPNQKLSYSTNSLGMTMIGDTANEDAPAPKAEQKVDIQDINKKLDEILAGDLTPGV